MSKTNKNRKIYGLKWFRLSGGVYKGAYITSFKYPRKGKWTKPESPRLCFSGFHVSNGVDNWYYHHNRIYNNFNQPYGGLYLVECGGKRTSIYGYKVSFEKIKIIKKINIKKLLELNLSSHIFWSLSRSEKIEIAKKLKLPPLSLLRIPEQFKK